MASRGTTWDALADELVANGHRLVVPDMRGHGSSGRASRYPLGVFADDMLALLDELALDGVDVIGHSLSAYTPLTMAQREPTRFGALVIEDAPIPPLDSADAANVARKLTSRRVVASAGVVTTIALALWRRFDLKMARPTIAALREPFLRVQGSQLSAGETGRQRFARQ